VSDVAEITSTLLGLARQWLDLVLTIYYRKLHNNHSFQVARGISIYALQSKVCELSGLLYRLL
jgi:hypothetical protein